MPAGATASGLAGSVGLSVGARLNDAFATAIGRVLASQITVSTPGTSAATHAGSAVAGISPAPIGAGALSSAGLTGLITNANVALLGTQAIGWAGAIHASISAPLSGSVSTAAASDLDISAGFVVPTAFVTATAAQLAIFGTRQFSISGAQVSAVPANLALFILTPDEAQMRGRIRTLPTDLRSLSLPQRASR